MELNILWFNLLFLFPYLEDDSKSPYKKNLECLEFSGRSQLKWQVGIGKATFSQIALRLFKIANNSGYPQV